MTRAGFHEELEKTELELLSLGELAGTAVQRAIEALDAARRRRRRRP